MSSFAFIVPLLSSPSPDQRALGLGSLRLIDRLPGADQLAIVYEPGLLAALACFLDGNHSLSALEILSKLLDWKGRLSASKRLCQGAVFGSPCFPSLMGIAATGGSQQLKRKAWAVVVRVTCIEQKRRRAVLDSLGMVALLQAGLESEDNNIAVYAVNAVSNLSLDKEAASAMLDDHPDLVQALANTFDASGFCSKFERESANLYGVRSLFLFPSPSLSPYCTLYFVPTLTRSPPRRVHRAREHCELALEGDQPPPGLPPPRHGRRGCNRERRPER